MDIIQILIVVLGLCLFEVISSVDNAIINAHVLRTLPEKFKKIFLTFGLLIAVVVVRGMLPFLKLLWLTLTNVLIYMVSRLLICKPSLKTTLQEIMIKLFNMGFLMMLARLYLF